VRPISDRDYQAQMQEKLQKFLSEHSFSCTEKMLKQPTRTEFIRMFEMVYRMMEPNYDCSANIEDEVTESGGIFCKHFYCRFHAYFSISAIR
jgi:SMC interacting uncharacterized protein involved in chromosome segregation